MRKQSKLFPSRELHRFFFKIVSLLILLFGIHDQWVVGKATMELHCDGRLSKAILYKAADQGFPGGS